MNLVLVALKKVYKNMSLSLVESNEKKPVEYIEYIRNFS